MVYKKVCSFLMAMFYWCSVFGISASAVNYDTFEEEEIVSEYAIARNPISSLAISQGTASCTSRVDGLDCSQITVTHTLQKYSGWLWIWDDVSGASWSKTVNFSSISLSNSMPGLASGTYRLMSVFTLTSSSGQTETITIYSSERTI